MPESYEAEIAKLEKNAAQYAERKLRTVKLKNSTKERNHRLIVVGAVVESILGRDITEDQIPNLKSFLIEAKNILGDFRSSVNGDC